ncbi:efflux RND transporter periplasmic adaptor subunit [Pseudoalteromonas sp. L21]|uniref:efflux RND transporter periplasmic adaptor subunit n=1 Tax=Pseudoalteromonas sp. L21 TaxID=1539746 RepID=UPI001F01B27E|nr:efflux RND transporter periplasmic adaptor subunit [Pseudoalteromonas sp. L21]MCF7519619.1 efflux RND transporter periplasmic adaptor subunit [Pseudoalteromonas sp. L21]
MNNTVKLVVALAVGAALATAVNKLAEPDHAQMPSAEKKPLYWVAPMDSNYRRDEPGLSPMGMELVPVYEEQSSAEDSPGTVRISPAVVNNLGVRTAPVRFKSLQTTVDTVGYVQYDQDQLVHIHPRVEGWIETLYVKAAGDQVKQGEPLYTLYSPQLVNAQEELLLALKRNNTVLIRAAKARLASLNVSDDFIARLEQSQKVRQNITFYAKQSGVLDELNIREGFYVKPGTTMMSIAHLEEVWVEAEVFERQAGLIHKGLPVTMTLDYLPGQRWQGKVDYIYPTLDEKNRTLRVRLRFANQDGLLKPNMFAEVSITAKPTEPQLVIAKEAVIRTGSQDRVVIDLGEGRFKSVAVTLGRSDNHDVEILSGLLKDDNVVVSAQFLIDSESSKSSDFMRMQEPDSDSAMVNGVINSIDREARTAVISREAIPKWGRDAATMEFHFSPRIDMSSLQSDDEVHFTFKLVDGEFVIFDIMTLSHPMQGEMQ